MRLLLEELEGRVLLSVAYQMIDLGSLGGGNTVATAINDSGQITGYTDDSRGRTHAFLWANGKMTDLGFVAGRTGSQGLAINALGDVAGLSGNDEFSGRPFTSIAGAQSELGLLPGYISGQAQGINSADTVVGWQQLNDGIHYSAFIYANGKLTNLKAYLGASSIANGVNDSGKVVGDQQYDNLVTQGFIYAGGKVSLLRFPGQFYQYGPSDYTDANAINARGDVVGSWGLAGDFNARNAYLYSQGKFTDIGSFATGGGFNTSPLAINDAGTVVGQGHTPTANYNDIETHAWVWRGSGSIVDLNNLIDPSLGYTLQSATGVNSAGQIIAYGYFGQSFAPYHSFLLTPVQASSISGVVFDDHNGDGKQEPGEPGIAGARVYFDGNKDGKFEDGQSVDSSYADRSTVTDAQGHFSFTSLGPGPYTIRVALSPQERQTTPANNGTLLLQLSAGQQLTAAAIGVQRLLLYSVTTMSTSNFFFPAAINDAGQVVGTFVTPSEADHPFLFSNGHFTDLGVFGRSADQAMDINNKGQILISSNAALLASPADAQSFILTGGKVELLHYGLSFLDDVGDVFGRNFYLDAQRKYHQVYVNGDTQDVEITSVNSRGDFAGVVNINNYGKPPALTAAFAFIGGKFIDLAAMVGDENFSSVIGINDRGEVLMQGNFLYSNGKIRKLTPLGYSQGFNNSDQTLCSFEPDTNPNDVDAALLSAGKLIDLNNVLPNGFAQHLSGASLINNSGTIVAGNLLLTHDYGSISGSVFIDANHDATLEAGEKPLGGVRVYLDLNNNGRFDAGEPSAMSASTGYYTIGHLDGGSFTVRASLPPGWQQTTPLNGSGISISLEAGDKRTIRPFGLAPLPDSIRSIVFNDANADGIRQSTESGLAGIRVYADLNHNGVFDAGEPFAITDGDGDYTITRLRTGRYLLRQILPAGRKQTTPPRSTALSVTLAPGGNVAVAPFGQAATV